MKPDLPIYLELTAVRRYVPESWSNRLLISYLDRFDVLTRIARGRPLIETAKLQVNMRDLWLKIYNEGVR